MTSLSARCFFLTMAVVALSTLPAQVAGAHPASFTLEQVLEAPYPSDLTAAPHGSARIALKDEISWPM